MLIRKANGTRVQFDRKKVESTCIRAGATRETASRISALVAGQIFPDITTRAIYKMVLRALAFEDQGIKHRYQLKESIMMMGPMGFPFEVYVSKILENYGYQIHSLGQNVHGHCISHEIDIITSKNNRRYMIECKYHNTAGKYTGVKESLYTHARFLDLRAKFQKEMLVSNTKISSDTIRYAKCVGQDVLCWRYPAHESLEKMIENKGLYPITILHLFQHEVPKFAQQKIMLIKDLMGCNASEISAKTRIPTSRIQKLQKIAEQIIR